MRTTAGKQAMLNGPRCGRPRYLRGAMEQHEVSVSRIFDMPRDRVFAAWTRPECLMGWWGLSGNTMTFCTVDLRPGGAFLCRMRSPEGRDVWSGGVYHEVVEAERLVFTAYFGHERSDRRDGRSDDLALEKLVTVTFADHGGKTKVTLREASPPMPAAAFA
jgi:uncharacterized protein YndB with AHSA1/START domain